MGRIIEQVSNPEIHAAAAGEHLMANSSRNWIGVRLRRREGLGEGDADLHRTSRANRIAISQQQFSKRHPADEIIVQLAQLLFGLHSVQPLAVALAVA